MATNLQQMFLEESMDEYRMKRADYLSSHQLADFRKSPIILQMKKTGRIKDQDSPAFAFGRAAHTKILEPDLFDETYATGGPINPRTNKCFGRDTKAFATWLAEQPQSEFVTEEEIAVLDEMFRQVHTHKEAAELLREGVAEGVVRHKWCGIDCQIRPDFYSFDHGIVDLKTCQDLNFFEYDARRYQYGHQLSFYRSVLNEAYSVKADVHIVAVEKEAPHRVGVWKIADELLDYCERENAEAIEKLKECIDTKNWPSYFEDKRILSLEV